MSPELPKIFISHIHEEADVAGGIQRLIEGNLRGKVEVFRSSDRWKMHAGEPWLDRIRKELLEARVVVLVLSAESVKRPWVNFEAGAAWLSPEKLMIPVCFGGLSKGSLPLPYSTIQALDIRTDQLDLIYAVGNHVGIFLGPPSMIRTKFEGETLIDLLDRIEST